MNLCSGKTSAKPSACGRESKGSRKGLGAGASRQTQVGAGAQACHATVQHTNGMTPMARTTPPQPPTCQPQQQNPPPQSGPPRKRGPPPGQSPAWPAREREACRVGGGQRSLRVTVSKTGGPCLHATSPTAQQSLQTSAFRSVSVVPMPACYQPHHTTETQPASACLEQRLGGEHVGAHAQLLGRLLANQQLVARDHLHADAHLQGCGGGTRRS